MIWYHGQSCVNACLLCCLLLLFLVFFYAALSERIKMYIKSYLHQVRFNTPRHCLKCVIRLGLHRRTTRLPRTTCRWRRHRWRHVTAAVRAAPPSGTAWQRRRRARPTVVTSLIRGSIAPIATTRRRKKPPASTFDLSTAQKLTRSRVSPLIHNCRLSLDDL